jgi:hypothetical protein
MAITASNWQQAAKGNVGIMEGWNNGSKQNHTEDSSPRRLRVPSIPFFQYSIIPAMATGSWLLDSFISLSNTITRGNYARSW